MGRPGIELRNSAVMVNQQTAHTTAIIIIVAERMERLCGNRIMEEVERIKLSERAIVTQEGPCCEIS